MTYYIRRSTIFFDLYWPLHHTYWSRNVFVFLIKLAPVASWDFDTVPISLCPHHLSWSGLCGPSPQLVVHWPCYPAYLICPERSQKIIKASLARIRSSTTRKDSLTWRQHWFGAWVIIFYFFFLLLIFCTSNSVPGCYSIGHKVFSRRCGFILIAHLFFFLLLQEKKNVHRYCYDYHFFCLSFQWCDGKLGVDYSSSFARAPSSRFAISFSLFFFHLLLSTSYFIVHSFGWRCVPVRGLEEDDGGLGCTRGTLIFFLYFSYFNALYL